MKNQTKATKAMDAYAALMNNVQIIEGLCNRVDGTGKIIELSGAVADSQIADVLDDINLILTANSNSGAGTYTPATGKYVVNADSYISNSATNAVEIASLDFSNFLETNAVKWAAISGDDTVFLSQLSELKVALGQFRDSVSSFIL
jgi:hypothetical protein